MLRSPFALCTKVSHTCLINNTITVMADEFKGGKAAASGLKQVFGKLDYAVKYSSNWVFEWTPFILTICYWVSSICFFVSCDEKTIKGFYYFFMFINFY